MSGFDQGWGRDWFEVGVISFSDGAQSAKEEIGPQHLRPEEQLGPDPNFWALPPVFVFRVLLNPDPQAGWTRNVCRVQGHRKARGHIWCKVNVTFRRPLPNQIRKTLKFPLCSCFHSPDPAVLELACNYLSLEIYFPATKT